MKDIIITLVCVGILAVVTGSPYVVTYNEAEDNTISPHNTPLLGRKACTRGPAYWCYNITQAKQCGAVSHCITKVWEPMKLPDDNDDVCKVCKEMVKEARDQLLSNETQDELRQVLEGSCNLIPLKVIAAECRKLSDDFIPELVDALASRMDPEVVCAISGLCNNVRIDEMLREMKEMEPSRTPAPFDLKENSCPKCNHYIGKAVTYLKGLSKEELVNKMLQLCGHMDSYSDSCRAIVMTEQDTIYNHVQNEMNSEEMCGLVGLCEVVSIHPVKIHHSETSVRVWSPPVNDDLECEFCKQLVIYLRNWFTADTTKEEFHDLIIGLCKETGKYRQECLNLAKQYGKEVYDLILEGLDPEEVCSSSGICINNTTIQGRVKLFSPTANVAPIWTLLPVVEDEQEIPLAKLRPAERLTGDDEKRSHQPGVYPMLELSPSERLTGEDEKRSHQPGVYPMLELSPSERLAGDDEMNVEFHPDPEKCKLCQAIAVKAQKFLQDHENATEVDLAKVVRFYCKEFIKDQAELKKCYDIVETYGHAFVHVMIKDMDPDIVCPAIQLCPIPTVDIDTPAVPDESESEIPVDSVGDILPTCGICQFTITKIIDLVGGNRSKESIDAAVNRVCYVIPAKYKDRCLSFMNEYGDKVAEMILFEGTAHGICTALHLCLFSPAPAPPTVQPVKLTGTSYLGFDRYMPKTLVQDAMEQIKKNYPSLHAQLQPVVDSFSTDDSNANVQEKPTCALCEFFMTQLDSMLENNATEQEIKDTVEHVCDYLPKTVRTQCRQFVDEYGDLVISYLAQSLEPREICVKLSLCDAGLVIIDYDGSVMDAKMNKCDFCIMISEYISAFLEDPTVDQSIEGLVEEICPLLPVKHRSECKTFIEDYGPYLISMLAQETDKGKACQMINLCPPSQTP